MFKDNLHKLSSKFDVKLATLFVVFALCFHFIDFNRAVAADHNTINPGIEDCIKPYNCTLETGVITKIVSNRKSVIKVKNTNCTFYVIFDIDSLYCPTTNLSYKYFVIQKLEFENNDMYCAYQDSKRYMQQAIAALIFESDAHLHWPNFVPLTDNVGFVFPSCMIEIKNSSNILKELIPCDTTKCCAVNYQIRRDPSGMIIDAENQLNQNMCPSTPTGICSNVKNMCDNSGGFYASEISEIIPDYLQQFYENCEPDGECPWELPLNAQFETVQIGSCTYFVYYTMRRSSGYDCLSGCNSENAFRFHFITTNGNSQCTNDPKSLLNVVIKYFVRNSKIIFNKNGLSTPFECFQFDDNLKIYLNSCWERLGTDFNYRYIACNDECCNQTFTFVGNGGFIDVNTTEYYSNTDCNLQDCQYVCETLNLDDYYFNSYKISNEYIIGIENNFQNKTISNKLIKINFESVFKGKITLLIFDESGAKVDEIIINKNNLKLEYNLDISKYNVGLYSYIITIDKINYSSGIFIKE